MLVLAAGDRASRADQGVSRPQWHSFSRMSLERKPKAWSGWEEAIGEESGAGAGAGGGPGEEVCSPRLPRARCLCLHLWNVADSLWGEPGSHRCRLGSDIWRLNSRRRDGVLEADVNFEGQTEPGRRRLRGSHTPHPPTPGFWERGEAPSPALSQPLSYQGPEGDSVGQGNSVSSAVRPSFRELI